jgi:hypothetical protein
VTRSPRLRRRLAAGALALAAIAPLGITSVAAAPAAPAVTTRSFSCTGIISRDYTRQTVNGTLAGQRPSNLTVLNYLNTVVHSTPTAKLTNGWWGGYWKATYQLNQWSLGKASDTTNYHLMLPDTRIGATFDALLVSEFGGGTQGNWQNWMTCTAA